MSSAGFSLPFDVTEPSVSLSLFPEEINIDNSIFPPEITEDEGPTLRIHQMVENWEQLSINLKMRVSAGAMQARTKEVVALVRVICSAAPNRHTVVLTDDGTGWTGTLRIDRDAYRGSINLTGELVIDQGARGVASPRATFEPSPAVRIELDPNDAPPAGTLAPRWIKFTEEASRYREIQSLTPRMLSVATSLLAYNLEKQEWHWVWNSDNQGWKKALPDNLFGKAVYLRRAVSTADGIATVRAALLLGAQSALAEMWTARSKNDDETFVLPEENDPFLHEVRTWAIDQYCKHKGVEKGDDVGAFLFAEMDEITPDTLTPLQRAEALLSNIVSVTTSHVLDDAKFAGDLDELREAAVRANRDKKDSES